MINIAFNLIYEPYRAFSMKKCYYLLNLKEFKLNTYSLFYLQNKYFIILSSYEMGWFQTSYFQSASPAYLNGKTPNINRQNIFQNIDTQTTKACTPRKTIFAHTFQRTKCKVTRVFSTVPTRVPEHSPPLYTEHIYYMCLAFNTVRGLPRLFALHFRILSGLKSRFQMTRLLALWVASANFVLDMQICWQIFDIAVLRSA